MHVETLCSEVTVWRETLANLVNDHKFAKFKSSKFYFSNKSRDLEAQLALLYLAILLIDNFITIRDYVAIRTFIKLLIIA